jgi:capsular exopolysaccharide synthesis family protein
MDKLEKALQKARELRGNTGYGTRSGKVGGKFSDVVLPQPEKLIRIQEETLERYRILAHHTRNKKADIFRILRTRILHIMKQSGLRTLAITSPNYNDGKTTIALNLALSISLDLKQTVLLADMDLRKPGITTYLGISSASGLTDHIMDDRPVSECLLRTSFERLVILPSGRILDNSSEVLGSSKMGAFARELKARYDDRIVIYDMPPILAQDDPLAFLPHIDAVLMVVREGVTKVDEIRQSMDALSQANVIGMVLNHSTKH